MQKTVREWLDELPEPYRSQALDNLSNPQCDSEPEYPSEWGYCLCNAFDWDKTPQGHDYWLDISVRCNTGDILPTPTDSLITIKPPLDTERQTAEALLNEFKDYLMKNKQLAAYTALGLHITDFLTHKYGTKPTEDEKKGK